MKKVDNSTETAIMDYLFLLLIFILVMFMVAIPLINPIAKNKNVDAKGEYIIQMEWDDGAMSDMDLWVRDPANNIVSFMNKSAGFMFLDIDDLGGTTDCMHMPDGEVRCININREIVTLRGIVPGEYVVNVFFYSRKDDFPEHNIKAKLIRINPRYQEITQTELRFDAGRRGDERTLFRFELNADGEVVKVSNLETTIARKHVFGE
jgi:hypothetical protein